MQLAFYQPLYWLGLLLILGVGYAVSLVDRSRPLKVASFLCRVVAVVLLALALCRPFVLRETRDLHVVFLVDVSESVDLPAVIEAVPEIERSIRSLTPSDSYSIGILGAGVRFLKSTDEMTVLLQQWRDGIADDAFRSATRLPEGLLTSRLKFPASKARRIVLYSDGRETHRPLSEAMPLLAKEEIDVLWRPLVGVQAQEAAVVGVETSASAAFEGETVRMRVKLAANQAQNAKLRVLHQGVVMRELDVALEEGSQEVDVDVPMTTPGKSVWKAELAPGQDHFPLNNQSSVTVQVTGKPRLLILHDTPKTMRNLSRALKKQEIEVDVRGVRGLPESMEGLLAFDAVVLADVPATAMTSQQMEWLKQYVLEFGGGIAMLGAENTYGLGGYYKTPVEEVLPLISRFEKEKENPSLAIALVMDKSGSMQGLPIELARQAAKASVEVLSGRDQIGVVGFDGQPQIISELRRAAESEAIHAAIDSLATSGGTNVYLGMVAGKDMLDNATAKIKHMIVMTDGQTSAADFHGLVQAMTENGITVSSVALGTSAARELLATIADLGRGRYYETVDPATVPQIFTKETMQASRSAIKEDLYSTLITGDHAMLSGYREKDLPFLLGYVMTEPKPTSQVLLAAETGDPLLAVGRYGLGTGMAYTSDLSEKWGAEWLAWDECGKFWAQVFRGIFRKASTRGLEVTETIDREQWEIQMLRRDPNRLPVNDIAWDVQATTALGKNIDVPVRQIGLGRYEASVSIRGHEKLSLRVHDTHDDLLKVLHYHRPYPREYALSGRVSQALEGGARYAEAGLRDGLRPLHTRQSVASWLYLGALALVLVGLLLRRV